MQTGSSRQSRRVAQRRDGQREPVALAATWGDGSPVRADERRHALVMMILFGLAFVGVCIVYLVLAGDTILGS